MPGVKRNKFLLILLLIVFVLRIPTLLEPYWYGDEGIYLTISQALKNGFALYKDVFDNKPPLVYLLGVMAGGNLFWFRFLLDAFVLISIFVFYLLAKKLLKTEKQAQISTVVFAGLTTFRTLEGNIANAELFILLPTLVGFNWWWKKTFEEKSENPWEFLAVGMILGIGFLFKAIALFDFLAIFCFLIFFKEKKSLLKIEKTTVFLGLGYFLPFLATCVYFWGKGTFGYFWESCFTRMTGYLSSWQTGTHRFSLISLLKSELMLRGGFLIGLCFGVWVFRKKLGLQKTLVLLWFYWTVFSATLSGRPYAHYLIQIVPSLALIVGFLGESQKRKTWLVMPFLILLAVVVRYKYWFYPTFSYYRNFGEFLVGKKTKEEYFAYFNFSLPRIYKVGETITAYTKPKDKIFVWGDDPYLYCLSKRLPASRFLVAYHVIDLGQQTQTINQIEENKPELIVVNQKTKNFPELEVLIKDEYFLIEEENEFKIYKKVNNKIGFYGK